MNMTTIQTTKREVGPRSALTQLRKQNQLPAVIYGYKVDSTPIYVDLKEVTKLVQQNGRNGVFKLDVNGKTVSAVLSEIQRDALMGSVKHVDFLAINLSEELEVDIPVTIIGEAKGVNEGGILNQPNRDIKIKVKPSDIPDTIEVEVSELAIGDSLSIADIREHIKFEIINDDDYTLANVTPPAASVEEEAEGTDATADDLEATGERDTPDKPGRVD